METNNLKSKAFSSALWKFAERFLAQFISLVVSIVLARMLVPEDYSVVSIVGIFFAFANILISGGLNQALIQKKESDALDFSSVLFVSLLLSFGIYAVLFFVAPWISDLYSQPLLVPIIRTMSLVLPINALKSVLCAHISKTLQFRKFFFATLGGTLFSAVVGIGMAYAGMGPWALVAQQMSNATIDTIILLFTCGLKFAPKISFERLKWLWSYGWKMLVSSTIGTIYTELVPLVTGLKFSTSDLSFYSKGKSFPSLLSTTTTSTLSSVLFPVLTKVQDDKDALLRYVRRYISIASYIAFPVMLGLFAVAENFVLVLLTEKWLPAVPYIRIFCVSMMFDMVHSGNCEAIKAIGRSDIFLIMEIVKKSGYFITIVLFMFIGSTPEALASAYIICTAIAIIVNSIPNNRLIGYKYSMQFIDLVPNLLISIGMCFVVQLIGYISFSPIVLLVVQIVIGIALYIILSLITRNKNFNYLLDLLKTLVKKEKK